MSALDAEGRELIAFASQVREMDRRAIEDYGLPGRVLMELAGASSARWINENVEQPQRRALVFCGPGGNGGDGYVVARHLQDRGWAARCISTVAVERLTGDTRANRELWDAVGGETLHLADQATARMRHHVGHANVIVDALFGTGQRRPVEPALAELVNWANEATHGRRVSLDVPTGVHADTGATLGPAFQADITTTYGVAKPGLYQGPGLLLSGEVVVVPIGLPREVIDAVDPTVRRLTEGYISAHVPARPADGHKGLFGHVGVVGGVPGMEGAALLAARGALRSGVGLVTWNTAAASERELSLPEVMSHVAASELDGRSEVVVAGPGPGKGAPGVGLMRLAMRSGRPLVLDADGLRIIAAEGLKVPTGSVLTPHPGEAAALLKCTTAEVQSDRIGAAQRLVNRFNCTVVLKGAGTLIASPDDAVCLIDVACPTLAIAGSGDVLAGLIAGLRAQGLGPRAAAQVGAWVHARAGVYLTEQRGDRGSLASEIADVFPALMSSLARP